MTTRAKDDPVPRDPRFDAAWRAASPDEPPATLDAAIRAAARREVGAGPQRVDDRAAKAARRRWWPLAAAATVAAIAVGVIQHVTHEDLVAPAANNAVVTDMPARGPSASSVAEPAAAKKEVAPAAGSGAPASEDRGAVETAAPAKEVRPQAAPVTSATKAAPSRKAASPEQEAATRAPEPAPITNDGSAARRMDALQSAAPAAPPPSRETTEGKADAASRLPEPFPTTPAKLAQVPAPPAPPAPPAAAAPAPAARAEFAARPPAANAGAAAGFASAPRPLPMGKVASADTQREAEARVKDRAPLSVPDWIALIRRLRTEGSTAHAARELAAFRAAHADHEKLLPADLRDWHPVEK